MKAAHTPRRDGETDGLILNASLVFKPTLEMKTLECGEKFCCEESWPSLGSSSLTRRWTNDAQIITTVTGRNTAKLSNTPYTILETIFNKYIL